MRISIIIFIISILLTSCGTVDKNMLVGNWQAVQLLEGGQPMEVDIQVVRFYFNKNQQYNFFGTLNYREAGSYSVESKYLYTLDTINQATTEKVVEIVHLTKDSLRLRMNDSGKERLMVLKKL